MSRTKSLAPLAASKNLVKWSSPAEPQTATRKLPPIKRVSRDSNFSESPRSSATGDMQCVVLGQGFHCQSDKVFSACTGHPCKDVQQKLDVMTLFHSTL